MQGAHGFMGPALPLELDKGHLEAAVAVVAMSMGLVMAGTGLLSDLI